MFERFNLKKQLQIPGIIVITIECNNKIDRMTANGPVSYVFLV